MKKKKMKNPMLSHCPEENTVILAFTSPDLSVPMNTIAQ
jgi:hypothetical protein